MNAPPPPVFLTQDPLLRRLAGLLPPGYIPTTVMQLVHNQSSPQEALAGPRTLYNTGAKDISQVWNVGGCMGLRDDVGCHRVAVGWHMPMYESCCLVCILFFSFLMVLLGIAAVKQASP